MKHWLLTILAGAALCSRAAETLDLSGEWKFRRDDNKVGIQEKWFAAPLVGELKIHLPGTMDEAELGVPNPVKPSLADLWRPNVYEGAAWYQREIVIPEAWRGKRVTLFLERCRWVTQAWLDGQPCGEPLDSLIAPHVHELGTAIAPGKHTLTLLVDNTKKIELGTFVSALYGGTQGNLNGIVGKIELRATPLVWIEDLQVIPNFSDKKIHVTGTGYCKNKPASEMKVNISLSKKEADGNALVTREIIESVHYSEQGKRFDLPFALPEHVQRWSEFTPALYTLSVQSKDMPAGGVQISTSFRDFAAQGTQFTMNGRPLFLRGTLECQVFPLTGYPPMDVASWQRIFRIEKSYGLNFIRFHSWCPPEAAFAAADIEGVMIQAEAPQANVSAGHDPKRDAFTEAELLRMIRTYGNHPSFCLMTLGNEYGGKTRGALALGGHAHQGRPAASVFVRVRARQNDDQPPVDGRQFGRGRQRPRHDARRARRHRA